ncbi:MAG: preprotein translocase subunit SecA [Chitinophagales bacterium]|nr:preprotein translocase subunit SecA [Saprospirales bacterium]MBP6659284.1 preprotein translocase subunit SecA [Chitinophagales bacterium]
MLNFLQKGLSKIFGSKSNRDIKSVEPIVTEINLHFEQYQQLNHDELRNKTQSFKERIKEYLSEIDAQIAELTQKAEVDNADLDEKEEIFAKVDKLNKERDEAIEEVLNEILPEAFAVVKEAARRFSTNEFLRVIATDLDRELAVKNPHIKIDGNTAIYPNKWTAAGGEIVWNMVHYDVQLMGGVVLHRGKISEMATGEGKTLVSTLPAYLNALAGCGVHLVTVNDYLARRDSEWNGLLFNFLGITVDCIDKHEPHSDGRKAAYLADITYGTNNEFGFDYLRDNMVRTAEEQVQRKLHFAMVDEVDSVLIDDARTPLIISGPVPKGDEQMFHELKPRIEKLVAAQKKVTQQFLLDAKKLITEGKTGHKEGEGGLALFRAHRGLPKNTALIKFLSEVGMKQILMKAENYYLQDQQKEMPIADAQLYFVIDEKNNQIDLTEKGIELITSSGEEKDFFVMPDIGGLIAEVENEPISHEEKLTKKDAVLLDFNIKSERLHTVNQLLKAYCLFDKDVEYVVIDQKVKIVDEQTGRIMDGRRYSDGLHQAIEAKENVKVEAATQTFATVTLQNFFRMYHKLCGMTGTAETEASEFWEIYKLDTVVVPTNRPTKRIDKEDLIYKTKREKYNAVIDEIIKLKEEGRPVLVGTTNVEVSELLSKMLSMRKIEHNVLNAKQHQREADIVAQAGLAGQITIATNMAGRGTDIKLGQGIKDIGGLAIIGSERHDSRRVDRQLRGRAGRQGDTGSTQFYASLEDDLMRLFGSDRIAGMMDKMGYKDGDVIQHSMVTKSIERAQKKVEENHFGTRKRLLEYDDVMNAQREVIYKRRHHALVGERISFDLINMFYDLSFEIANDGKISQDIEAFKLDTIRFLSVDTKITADDLKNKKVDDLAADLYHEVYQKYQRKSDSVAKEALPIIQNVVTINGDKFQNMVIPFSDGNREIQILANIEKSLSSKGKDLIKTIEQNIILSFIDHHWKDHLRQMDELKHSVQMAVHEQKDPLLIFKFEAFELFKQMLSAINKDVTTFLLKGALPAQRINNIQQVRLPKSTEKVKESRGGENIEDEYKGAEAATDTREKQQPVRAEVKIGRNDPCPCGSGKKYKQCHGKEMA